MAKAIFFNVPTSGHVNPTLPLTRELVKRGDQVIYYLTEGYRSSIEDTGATFRPYSSIDDNYFDGLDGSNPPHSAARLARTALEIMPDLNQIIQTEKPDYILYDSMCPWGWLAAEKHKLPHVSSNTLLMLTPGMILRSGQLFRLMHLTLNNMGHFRHFNGLRWQINRRYGIKAPGFPEFMTNHGTLTICYTSRMIQPEAEKFGESYKFVGPAIEPRMDKVDFPLESLDERPLVYISLGTVINRNPGFYKQCIEAFKEREYQVVISIGKQNKVEDLGELPENFIVRNFVPQLEILKQADIFITHAGMNSVHESLYYNVPLLLVPQQAEQTLVARRIEELGAGMKLERDVITPASLRSVTATIIKSRGFKQKARTLGESLRAGGGHIRAVDHIFAMTGRG